MTFFQGKNGKPFPKKNPANKKQIPSPIWHEKSGRPVFQNICRSQHSQRYAATLLQSCWNALGSGDAPRFGLSRCNFLLKKRWGICHFAMLVFNKGGMLNVGICRTPMLKLELFFWGLEYSPKLGRLPGWKDNTVFEVRHPVFFGQKAKTKLQIFRCPNGWISSQGHGSFKRNMLTLLWRPGHSHFCFSLRMRNAMRYTEFTWKLGHFLMEHVCTYYPTLKKYNLGPTTLIKAVRVVNISYMLHDPLWDGRFFANCRCLAVSVSGIVTLRMPTFAWELTLTLLARKRFLFGAVFDKSEGLQCWNSYGFMTLVYGP